MEKSESDIMKRQPRDPKEGIFAGGMGFDVVFQGLIVSVLVMISYVLGHYIESGVFEFVNSPGWHDDGLPHAVDGGNLPCAEHAQPARIALFHEDA